MSTSCVSITRANERDVLATIDDDVFRHHPTLQHSLLRVVAAASEQTRRFNLEITDLLLVAVN